MGESPEYHLHDRCGFFETMLLQCGLAQSRAEEDAHRLMHAISDEGFNKLRQQYS